MANAKKIIADWNETGKTVYAIVRRESDGFLLEGADGTFAAIPANTYLPLSEHAVIKGRYEAGEDRTVWNDGRYTAAIYLQSGASPAPAADTMIGTGEMALKDDAEVYTDVPVSSRLAAASYTPPDNNGISLIQAKLDFVEKWILNKLVESPSGTWKLYDDDGVSVLKTWVWDGGTKTRQRAV